MRSNFSRRIAYKNNLTDPEWAPLENVVTGNGLTQSVTDKPSQSQRFQILTVQ
jgi:hypothetical protein